ncbi:MAG: septum formation initiator family protein [Thiolinea sp.]
MKITQLLLFLLSLLALLLFTRLWFGTGSFPEIWELESQIEQQTAANAEQLQRNKQLESDVDDLGKSNDAIEGHARSELGMVRKNETFYQIILREDKQNPLMSSPELTEDTTKNDE